MEVVDVLVHFRNDVCKHYFLAPLFVSEGVVEGEEVGEGVLWVHVGEVAGMQKHAGGFLGEECCKSKPQFFLYFLSRNAHTYWSIL